MNAPGGAMLCDRTIRALVASGDLRVEPYRDEQVQPASYDLRIALPGPVTLEHGRFYLFDTIERLALPADMQGQVHGRSSLGRKGVLVHFTAGFIDPGFDGTITLEVMALAGPVELRPGDRVAQVSFARLDAPCETPYHGRYQHQRGATPSRFGHGDA